MKIKMSITRKVHGKCCHVPRFILKYHEVFWLYHGTVMVRRQYYNSDTMVHVQNTVVLL